MPDRQIVALQAYSRMSNGEIVVSGTALVDSVDGNPHFPKPPISLAVLRAAIELLKALIAAALDGDKKVIAQRNQQREEVIRQLRLLVRYVEIACNGEMEAFRSSSLEPAYANRRPQASWTERIRRIDRDRNNSGTLLVFLNADEKAAHYELRYRPLGQPETEDSWTTFPITNVKSAIKISGLTPATTYSFQVRMLVGNTYTDWTDPINFICT